MFPYNTGCKNNGKSGNLAYNIELLEVITQRLIKLFTIVN